MGAANKGKDMNTLVIFDVDGTLTRTVDADTACFAAAIGEVLGRPVAPNDWLASPHMTDSGISHYLFQEHHGRTAQDHELELFRGRFVELLDATFAANDGFCEPVPGARRLIECLRAEPAIDVAIATGACRAAASLKLERAGLFDWAIPLASSDDAIARTAIMTTAVERAKHRYEREEYTSIVYVGDGVWDAKACRELDWPLVGIATHTKADVLTAHGAAFVLPHFGDTVKTINTIMHAAGHAQEAARMVA